MTTVSPFRNEPTTDFADAANQRAFRDALERVRGQLGRTYPLRIGGQAVEHSRTFDNLNPARPNEVIGRHVVAGPADVEAGIAAADRTFPSWAATPAADRAGVLFPGERLQPAHQSALRRRPASADTQ